MARPGDATAVAAPAHDSVGVPQSVRNLLTKARTAWLKNTEVLDLLSNYQRYNFTLNKTTPNCPPGPLADARFYIYMRFLIGPMTPCSGSGHATLRFATY